MTTDVDTYSRVGWTLLGALLVSIAVMVIGLIAVIATGASASNVLPLDRIWAHLARGDASAILDLGILSLFAAPLLAVAVALLQFLLQRDRTFAFVAALLLVVLAVAFGVALH
jgi:uncharacterized membrane protein